MHADPILDLFARRGDLQYDGEGITQLQHAWQCGRLAARAGAGPALQLAAWLHDLGHLIADLGETPTARGLDDRHEVVAAEVLRPLFGDAVADPVALHVQAKRCLVATSAGYRDRLSPDSQRSLALQGGPMTVAEAEAFMARPYAADALRLRAWDDTGKDATLPLPPAATVLQELSALMARCALTPGN